MTAGRRFSARAVSGLARQQQCDWKVTASEISMPGTWLAGAFFEAGRYRCGGQVGLVSHVSACRNRVSGPRHERYTGHHRRWPGIPCELLAGSLGFGGSPSFPFAPKARS